MNTDSLKDLKKNQGISILTTMSGISEVLNHAGNYEFKFLPIDTETSAILGRTLSWAAIGAGVTFLSSVAPMPLEARLAAVVAGTLIGAGAGYFTATHKIKISRINPGDSNPIFSVVIDPC